MKIYEIRFPFRHKNENKKGRYLMRTKDDPEQNEVEF